MTETISDARDTNNRDDNLGWKRSERQRHERQRQSRKKETRTTETISDRREAKDRDNLGWKRRRLTSREAWAERDADRFSTEHAETETERGNDRD